MYRILIVEDDEVISRSIEARLTAWGYEARRVTDLSDPLCGFDAFDPQLVLMDVSLPFSNGYHRCRLIRERSRVPVMFLSSSADNLNIVMAMNMGGDDFIAKPFDLDVLTAKVGALLRRSYELGAPTERLSAGGVTLDRAEAVLLCGETRVPLTRNELRILEVLIENCGRVIARDTLMTRLWETDSFVDDNTLTVNVTRLRKKLEEAGIWDLIKTRKGLGYLIEN